MLHDMFFNGVLLVAFLSIGSQILGNLKVKYLSSTSIKILMGIFLGLVGCLLTKYGVHVYGNVILDFRNIAIIISAIYAGMVPAIFTGIIIGLFRLLDFGITGSSILALVMALIISLICGLISRLNVSVKKMWIYSLGFALTVSSILLIINTDEFDFVGGILPLYWFMTILIAVFVYYYVKFLRFSTMPFGEQGFESRVDFLTGLNNVKQFDDKYNRAVSLAINNQQCLSLLYVDMDFFKEINDKYGYPEGNYILKQVGGILAERCRNVDIVSRIEGQRFSIILSECSSLYALEVAERIRSEIETNRFFLHDNRKINITVSIGIATYPDSTMEIKKLREAACDALWRAKRAGRNTVFLSEGMS